MARETNDDYPTPQALANAIVRHHEDYLCGFSHILEPSCGIGNWCEATFRVGIHPSCVLGCDINPDHVHAAQRRIPDATFVHGNFLDKESNHPPPALDLSATFRRTLVLGNPPYKYAQEFVEHGLKHGEAVGFLLRLSFLESKKRIPFWRDTPLKHVTVISERPSFTGKGTDASAYGFFIWERGYEGMATLDHLSWK